MRIDVLTLFPGMFRGPLDESIVKRAQAAGLVAIDLVDMRRYAKDRHRTVDDRPFGGGPGMVIKPDIVFEAVEDLVPEIRARPAAPLEALPRGTRIILTDPQGKRFDQAAAVDLAQMRHLVVLCGHYEGIDERVREHLVTDAFSIGDVVLTGGELAAMVMIDAVVRLLPGAVGKEASPREDSFFAGVLDHPHYTRPADFRGWSVPDILVSGHHREVAKWRRRQALERTAALRPDLLESAPLTPAERRWLADLAAARGYDGNNKG
ncbi:MAG: tRNA (guanosine(37)-N1)-methyltransferase TrmD [Candidatus Sericytochromatia bacterium]|nr:tRNA (guanosine(37)-N1)-methyltransferase TrmD [Candidatus Tanganyikabacteria bacterium]